ncbi:MAG TPA: hypothetical protein VEK33_01025 [Terriglobales bacterium]|nr:hypothetical protein [Terriglobales bacterium]
MKSVGSVSCAILALLLMAPLGAEAGPALERLTAEVPFDFMVKQVMFPSGKYLITLGQDRNIYLRARNGRESVSITAEPIRAASHSRSARLVFAEENGHYHLRELWMNSTTGREVPGPPMVQVRTIRAARVEVPASCTTCQ